MVHLGGFYDDYQENNPKILKCTPEQEPLQTELIKINQTSGSIDSLTIFKSS